MFWGTHLLSWRHNRWNSCNLTSKDLSQTIFLYFAVAKLEGGSQIQCSQSYKILWLQLPSITCFWQRSSPHICCEVNQRNLLIKHPFWFGWIVGRWQYSHWEKQLGHICCNQNWKRTQNTFHITRNKTAWHLTDQILAMWLFVAVTTPWDSDESAR